MKINNEVKLSKIFSKQLLTKLLPKMPIYIGLSAFFGWLIFKSFSTYDPNVEAHFGIVGRTDLIGRMLSIMSMASWGLLIFAVMIVISIVGDPYWRQTRQLSDED